MHEMTLVFKKGVFSGYGFAANIRVTTELPERKSKAKGIEGLLGLFHIECVTPIADIDLMMELSAQSFYITKIKGKPISMDDVQIECVIDEDGHHDFITILGALLAWVNHYDVQDDLIRESVADLNTYEMKMLLCLFERRKFKSHVVPSIIKNFFTHRDVIVYKCAEKIVGNDASTKGSD